MASSSSPSRSVTTAVLLAAGHLLLCVAMLFAGGSAAASSHHQLCEDYYARTCPDAYGIVKRVLIQAHRSDARIYASLIRLHFHDCFVQGCDASLLLDGVPGVILSEKGAAPNNNSARGYPVVDRVKAELEACCPGVVSCADILALAAEISVDLSGGPKWGVLLGRLDGKTANFNGASNLPGPFDNLTVLEKKFRDVGLTNIVDLVALSGAHTFGRVQCQFVTDRLYNFSGTNRPDPTLDAGYRAFLSRRCPRNGNGSALNDLDPTTPDAFDKNYFTNLEAHRGFLDSDQILKSAPEARGVTAPVVDRFAASQDEFFASFARAMINMGNIMPLLDPAKGEIRKNCRMVNGS